MRVVSNTTPFIALSAVGCLRLLEMLYGGVIIPEAVAEELAQGGPIAVPDPRTLAFVTVAGHPASPLPDLLYQLDYAESRAIVLALSEPCDLILLDDRQARNVAAYLGLTVKGSLGVLAEAKRRGFLASFTETAQAMQRQGIRFAPRLIREIALALGEDHY